jgi:thiol:disulfide interchange protein DsbD
VRYQACNDERCLPPRTLELAAARGAASAVALPYGDGGGQLAGWVARWGWGLTFVWVAVLGVALNLTPCVYPLISVTVAFFGGRTGRERGVVGHALLYVLGICITFSALGAGAALTGSLFGAALQRPAVLGAIAVLMAALAASNFGLYQLRLPHRLMQRAGRAGEGALGALVMGLTMGVVAAPCIGPIVLGLLLFVGARQSVPLGLALFFTLGLGMGLPYVGLALAAARVRRLPRSGAWLGWMERLFGFLLLALALHFATPLLPAVAQRALWGALLVVAGIVQGVATAGMQPTARWAARAGGVAVVAVALRGLLTAEVEGPIAWLPYSEPALAAAQGGGRPVLIDFQAAWCIPCREMERTTLRDPAVAREVARFVALRADVTADDETASAVMARHQVLGVPTYLFVGPDGVERARLVGWVPADRFLAALAAAVVPTPAPPPSPSPRPPQDPRR